MIQHYLSLGVTDGQRRGREDGKLHSSFSQDFPDTLRQTPRWAEGSESVLFFSSTGPGTLLKEWDGD